MHPPDEGDRTASLRGTYLAVMAVEALVILLLWWLGRIFS
jgi:hypothetical protein